MSFNIVINIVHKLLFVIIDFGELRRQRKIWMDNLKEDLKEKNIDLTQIGEAIRNREVWMSLVRASSLAR